MCELCVRTFTTKRSYEVHFKQYHTGANKNMKKKQCVLCDEFVYGPIEKHIDIHRNKEGKLPCRQCSVVFNAYWNVKRHIEDLHIVKDKIICPICESKFIRRPDMVKHFRVFHQKCSKEKLKSQYPASEVSRDKLRSEMECDWCGLFLSKDDIGRHQERLCPAIATAVPEKRKLHKRSKETTVTTGQYARSACNLCGREMVRKSISRHQRVGNCPATRHVKEMVDCDHCGINIAKEHLKKHLKRNCRVFRQGGDDPSEDLDQDDNDVKPEDSNLVINEEDSCSSKKNWSGSYESFLVRKDEPSQRTSIIKHTHHNNS